MYLDKCGLNKVDKLSFCGELPVNTTHLETGESLYKDINENFGAWTMQSRPVFLPVSFKSLPTSSDVV